MVDILNPTAWQEQDASNTSGSQPSFPELMPGKNVNDAARAMMGALKRWANQICGTKVTAGTASAYTVAYTQAPEALYTGQRFAIITHVACEATPTLNINALGAKAIRKIVGGVATDLAAGDIQANGILDLMYISSLNAFIWINPPPPTAGAPASPTEAGVIEISTRDEVQRGISSTVAVVPDTIGGILYKGATVAGGTSISLGDGGYFEISGAVFSATSIVFANTFSAFGRKATLKFVSAGGILVHSASLILPSAANITVAAGDTCDIVLESSGVYRVMNFSRASGQPVATVTNEIQVNKAADQSVTSSTALVDCTDLAFTVKAGKTYDIKMLLNITYANGTNGGFRGMFLPSVALASSYFLWLKGGDIAAPNSDENSSSSVSEQNVFATTSGELKSMILIEGVVKGGASDSLLKFQFAQSTSVAQATTVKADSYLRYRER